MRLAVLCILGARLACAQSTEGDTQAVIQTVERLFQAMASRDAAAIRATFLPGARFHAVRSGGAVSAGSDEEFIARITALQEEPLERMRDPRVLVSGRLATLWAEYDFHFGGRFSHCGVDAVQLVKTKEGWKIASLAWTVEKEECRSSPAGAPPPARPRG